MKYLCRVKDRSSYCGIGNSIEEALDDFQQDDDSPLKELEWYSLNPIKVKLTVDNVTKKETKK